MCSVPRVLGLELQCPGMAFGPLLEVKDVGILCP